MAIDKFSKQNVTKQIVTLTCGFISEKDAIGNFESFQVSFPGISDLIRQFPILVLDHFQVTVVGGKVTSSVRRFLFTSLTY